MCNQIVCLSLSKAVNRKRCIVNEVSLSFTNRLSPTDRRKLFCIFPCCADGVYHLIEIRASSNFNSKRVSGLYFFFFPAPFSIHPVPTLIRMLGTPGNPNFSECPKIPRMTVQRPLLSRSYISLPLNVCVCSIFIMILLILSGK